MKITPLPSTTPRVLAADVIRAAAGDDAVHLSVVADLTISTAPFLSLGIGGERNVRRIWLSRHEAHELIRKLEYLTVIL